MDNLDKRMDWRSYLQNNCKINLQKYQFPPNDQIKFYEKIYGKNGDDYRKLKKYFNQKFKQKFPEVKIIFGCTKHSNNRYRFCCTESNFQNKSACRAFMQYQFDKEKKYFKLLTYCNQHHHIPLTYSLQTIKEFNKSRHMDIQKQKKKFQWCNTTHNIKLRSTNKLEDELFELRDPQPKVEE